MEIIERKVINRKATSQNIKLIRLHNTNLRRYVCWVNRTASGECAGLECATCKYEMDHNVSQIELANIMNVSESMIANWESRTLPSIEDLLYLCSICELTLDDVIVYEK